MPLLRNLGLAAIVLVAALGVTDVAFLRAVPSPPRLGTNFSSAFLHLEIERLRREEPRTVFLGDSVLWGYALRPSESAPALLAADGLRDANFAFEGGSPANTYAMLELLLASGVRPARVVFNVNQKTFNVADSAYATLHPSVAPLARPLLRPADAALLEPGAADDSLSAQLDREAGALWHLYAMRADVREMLFGDIDAAHALHAALEVASGAKARADARDAPTTERFEGSYDLAPLGTGNVSVHYLALTVAALRDAHIPAVAILTPTNHALLHPYVDTPQYAGNLAYVRRLIERSGARVVDLDRAFAPAEFLDNDHLTAAGNRRLARRLATELADP